MTGRGLSCECLLRMKTIPLTQGKVALVDDEDFEWLNQWKWFAQKSKQTYYAQRHVWKGKGEKKEVICMHRLILGCKKGQITDHINGNGLDNRRGNLRIVTYLQNSWNRRKISGATSKYKGVHWHRWIQKWAATIGKGKNYSRFCQYFSSEREAAKAYDRAALERFGEYAKFNFPKQALEKLSTPHP